jgi:DNA-binding MltR family transcriptional regulator
MWLFRDQTEADFIREISTLSDRLLGLLAPIILEKRLREAIQHRWVDSDISRGTTILEDLFRPSGEIGSFGTMIRVGLAIALFGRETYADLVRIEKIRNSFAHRLDVKSFADQPIVDFVRDISVIKRWGLDRKVPMTLGDHTVVVLKQEEMPDLDTPRGKFLDAVWHYSNLLYNESNVRRADPRTPAF